MAFSKFGGDGKKSKHEGEEELDARGGGAGRKRRRRGDKGEQHIIGFQGRVGGQERVISLRAVRELSCVCGAGTLARSRDGSPKLRLGPTPDAVEKEDSLPPQ